MALPAMPARRSAFVQQAGLAERKPPAEEAEPSLIEEMARFAAFITGLDVPKEPMTEVDMIAQVQRGAELNCRAGKATLDAAREAGDFQARLTAEIRLQADREWLVAVMKQRGSSPAEIAAVLAKYD